MKQAFIGLCLLFTQTTFAQDIVLQNFTSVANTPEGVYAEAYKRATGERIVVAVTAKMTDGTSSEMQKSHIKTCHQYFLMAQANPQKYYLMIYTLAEKDTQGNITIPMYVAEVPTELASSGSQGNDFPICILTKDPNYKPFNAN